ncbi:MAG: hypothetical protein HOP19_23080 [Acidobacteria bacterium]|nr:hypothetical protein [Acidobacteriota bacterium]
MKDNDDFDYQAYTRETPPDPTKITRGPAARELRRAAAMLQQAVRIDPATLEQFRQLAGNGQSCEQLINQALQEWLAAQGLKEMVRTEMQAAVRQSLSAALQTGALSPIS